MFLFTFTLLAASSASSSQHHPLSRLDAIAVQAFGSVKAAPFLKLNRQLLDGADETSSSNDGGVSQMCSSEQFVAMCGMTEEQIASSGSKMSPNDDAKDQSDPSCAIKTMKSFYCDTLCSKGCSAFLASDAAGGQTSANDGGAGGQTPPSFMQNEDELAEMCADSCLKDLLVGITALSAGMEKCAEAGFSSGDDEAKEGDTNGLSATPTDPTESIEKALGTLCVKNEKNKYCMVEFAPFGTKYPNKPEGNLGCDSGAVKALVGMGWCVGSMIQMFSEKTDLTEEEVSDKAEMEEMAYWVSKCGGTILPCSAGAIKDVTMVSSTLSLQGDGLTQEAMEKPAVIAGIKKSLADTLKVKKDLVIVEKITVIVLGRERRGRALGSSTAEIKYSIIVEGGSAKVNALKSSIGKVDNTALTTAITKDPAMSTIAAGLTVTQSKEVTTESAEAKPDATDSMTEGRLNEISGAMAVAPTFSAIFVGIALTRTLM